MKAILCTQQRPTSKPQFMVRGIVLMDEWHQGYMMSQTVPLRHKAEAHCIYALHLYRGALLVDLLFPPVFRSGYG